MSIPKYFPLIFCQLLTDAFGDVSVYKAESLPFRKLCGQGVSQKQEHPILFYFCHLSLGPGSDSAPAAREGGYMVGRRVCPGYVLHFQFYSRQSQRKQTSCWPCFPWCHWVTGHESWKCQTAGLLCEESPSRKVHFCGRVFVLAHMILEDIYKIITHSPSGTFKSFYAGLNYLHDFMGSGAYFISFEL